MSIQISEMSTSDLYFMRHLLYERVEKLSYLDLDDNDPEVIQVDSLLDKIEIALGYELEQGL